MGIFSFKKPSGRWTACGKKDERDLLDFLLPLEHSCTAFTSRITGSSSEISWSGGFSIYIERDGPDIVSAILDSLDGTVIPVLSGRTSSEGLNEIIPRLSSARKRYLTLMGLTGDLETISPLFSSASSVSVDYDQLIAEASAVPAAVSVYLSGKEINPEKLFTIRRAGPDDIDFLMPLRKAYEIEEVLLEPGSYNKTASRQRFGNTVKNRTVIFAERDGFPAGTCGINAAGVNWQQIGGVYTCPEYRSAGLAAMLMGKLAKSSAEEGKNLTLFVKKDNVPALKLYDNCGFSRSADYRISYLERR